MKKIILERIFAFGLLLVAFVITGYFYQKGKISLFTSEKKQKTVKIATAEILFKDKEYKVSYKERPSGEVVKISDFEEGEVWRGDGEFDYANFIEGKCSLALNSQNHFRSTTTLSLKEGFNFEEIKEFNVFVFLKTPPRNLEEVKLILKGNGSAALYEYPIRDLNLGWNFLVLPKNMFFASTPQETETSVSLENPPEKSLIKSLTFEIVSRPRTISSINLDMMWAEKSNEFLSEWSVNDNRFLSLYQTKEGLNLLLNGWVSDVANLKKVSSAKDYTLRAKFTPIRDGNFGFFLRGDYKSGFGYYLMVDGIDKNSFQITKRGVFNEQTQEMVLEKGNVSNFKFEVNTPYWLKAVLKGPKISFYLSVDNKDFSQLSSVEDESYSFGGVGLTARNSSLVLVDDIQFSK